MKRSEFLKKIESIFDIPRYPRDKRLTADLVLKELEKLGMLPPEFFNGEHGIMVNEWESE